VSQGLVRDHHAAFAHHPLLDLWRNLVQLFLELLAVGVQVLEGGGQVPEADVCALWLIQNHSEVTSGLEDVCCVVGGVKNGINVRLKSVGALKICM
jgi:hypothetical protein